jgi:oligopeptide/dipeptide ABC transporter ATP-binding protein
MGVSLLLITHDLGLVAEYCDRVIVMYAGQIVEQADVYTIFDAPQHPYTKALVEAARSKHLGEQKVLRGQPPVLVDPPPGCRFAPRCEYASAGCFQEDPPNVAIGKERSSRCWLAADSELALGPRVQRAASQR